MRSFVIPDLEKCRRVHPTLGATDWGDDFGYFVVPVNGVELSVISSGSEPSEA